MLSPGLVVDPPYLVRAPGLAIMDDQRGGDCWRGWRGAVLQLWLSPLPWSYARAQFCGTFRSEAQWEITSSMRHSS